MSKEVDNGVKKFFIIFLVFIVALNILSIVLFGRSLFYYFSDPINIDGIEYNDILNLSMVGKCFIPVILICFFLILSFTIKQIKKYRRYIYPVMYILFLFVLEFIVLCFFKECLPYMKKVSIGILTVIDGVISYISIFHPLSLLSLVIYSGLMVIGNIFDNKSVGRKNSWYVIVISIILSLVIVILIGVVVSLFTNSLSLII